MTPPLRILQFNSLLKGGGTDDQCIKLCRGLMQPGQAVWLAGVEGRELIKVVRDLGIRFAVVPATKVGMVLATAKLARRERVQIIHAHHGRDYWPAILAARLSGSRPKVVLTRHMAKSPSSWVSRHFLLSRCDALIGVSDFVAKILREGVNEPDSPEPERRVRPPLRGDHSKIVVIHGGIDPERFRPMNGPDIEIQRREWGLGPAHYAFAVVGSYDFPRGKGQREFLVTAARVHKQIPQARFLIIGRGNMADMLKADIERLGLAGKAWLTPYCTDMPRTMNAIDCLVHPQIGTEAFGLVVCEAFACGKPVIASALDGIPEAFAAGNYGRLVKAESVEELAAALLEWATRPPLDPEQRATLHDQIAGRFSLSVNAGHVKELYERLISPQARSERNSASTPPW